MLQRIFALMAVVALALGIGTAVSADDQPGTHEGKVVKTEPGKLTMTDKQGKNQHTHAIPATAKITFEGKACKLEDLKAGNAVKVTTEKQGDKVVVTTVEATKSD
jgi:hypothetical protein